ncbi:MAG: (d)CMP kinase [Betaproteobacteria bacterium]
MTIAPIAPVIAIDGPTASGKGTVAAEAAAELDFHYLDSGALYRIVGLAAIRSGARLDDGEALAGLARHIEPRFVEGKIIEHREDITGAIRGEEVSRAASQCAIFPLVRQALLDRQHAFRRPPGLVADGRDMGTVVFPDAVLKVYLTASVAVRAGRRHKQLIEKGIPANIDGLLRDLQERDSRDSGRLSAPLAIASDALVLDTSSMSIDDAVAAVIAAYRSRR